MTMYGPNTAFIFSDILKITFSKDYAAKYIFLENSYFRIPTINVHIYWEYEKKKVKKNDMYGPNAAFIFSDTLKIILFPRIMLQSI